jgi:hypothetical protein
VDQLKRSRLALTNALKLRPSSIRVAALGKSNKRLTCTHVTREITASMYIGCYIDRRLHAQLLDDVGIAFDQVQEQELRMPVREKIPRLRACMDRIGLYQDEGLIELVQSESEGHCRSSILGHSIRTFSYKDVVVLGRNEHGKQIAIVHVEIVTGEILDPYWIAKEWPIGKNAAAGGKEENQPQTAARDPHLARTPVGGTFLQQIAAVRRGVRPGGSDTYAGYFVVGGK